ncbi:hemerythrin domain-containing protein [Mycobacterium sp. pUA109]|uniref:hemerythrin domain-containing protein n=1 Tax=Mycobacterium sp. pUA109 TaxID=3238982 RepID=UPI00351AB6EA
MSEQTVSAVLEREHRDIDSAIEVFLAKLDAGTVQPEPLTAALAALRRHIYIEEVFLFPPVREAGLVMPVFVMLREHGELWQTMDALTALLAAGSDIGLRDTCRRLLAQLDQHNAKEEPIIYPQAATALPSHTSAELLRFVDTGHTPDGWVCQRA